MDGLYRIHNLVVVCEILMICTSILYTRSVGPNWCKCVDITGELYMKCSSRHSRQFPKWKNAPRKLTIIDISQNELSGKLHIDQAVQMINVAIQFVT